MSRPPTTFRVLALDLASKTGYCIMDNSHTIITSGEARIKVASDSLPAALQTLEEHLDDLHASFPFDAVCAEAISPQMARHTQTARVLFGLNVTAERWCAENGKDFLRPLPAPTLKKHAANLLGHAKSVRGKEQVLEASAVLLGREPKSSDEADAVIIAAWAIDNAVDLAAA